MRKGVKRQWSGFAVNVSNHFAGVVISFNRQQWAENLALHHLDIVGHVKQQGERKLVRTRCRSLARHQVNGGGAFGDGIVQRGLQALISALVNNGGVIIVVDIRIALSHQF